MLQRGHGGVFTWSGLHGGLLTQFCEGLAMAPRAPRLLFPALASVCAFALAGCDGPQAPREAEIINAADPQVARALNDPLMVDPDLSHRSEANAAITIAYDHALPSLRGTDESARRARETARLELLEEGAMDELPEPGEGAGLVSLEEVWDAAGVLAALGAPEACREDVASDFALAADLPEAARVMPHGMVRAAAGADTPACTMRLVRYATPAAVEDVLQYHFNVAKRAGLSPRHFAIPEPIVRARQEEGGGLFEIHARPASGNLTFVDLVYWKRP